MKKAFTLLEIIVVVIIIWLLLASMSNVFEMKDRDLIRSKTCVDSSFWTIKNFFDMASTWKGVYTWTDIVYPESYIINFNTDEDNIELTYSWNDTWTYESIIFNNDDWVSSDYCYDNTRWYHIQLSWDISEIKVSRLLQSNINSPAIIIDNDPVVNMWYFDLFYVPADKEDKRILNRYIFDRRVQQLRNSRCLQRGNNFSTCDKWTQSLPNETNW